ncbi:MAG: iron-containing alcohol dehydrogenase [Gammaproteobacteria bacterium]|nr:iron-containing alcohol dehydrogenase [Gammaproteobacteria bacterium]
MDSSSFNFNLSALPNIEIGSGVFESVVNKILLYGKNVLIITGKNSFIKTSLWAKLNQKLNQNNIIWFHAIVDKEPSPDLVDKIVKQYYSKSIDCVLAIGGGSCLDTAKAVSGLITSGDSVMEYLEGVGAGKIFLGPSLPFIAVPTTAGTGSEATKNAVLSQIGKDGFKKSFRHESLMPQYALLDPELLSSCPKSLIAANGMDALTQLIEAYVSSKANAFSDAIVLSGIEAVRDSLLIWYLAPENDNSIEISTARVKMAYAALISGIALAQVGLGSVHGLASPLGAFYPIPHGMACGTLLSTACEINIDALKQRDRQSKALTKYAQIGRILTNQAHLDQHQGELALMQFLQQWSETMTMQKLSDYGVRVEEFDHIVANSRGNSMQTNPIVLTDEEIKQILARNL